MDAGLDDLDDAVVNFNIKGRAGWNDFNAGAHLACVGDSRAGFDAKGFGFITRCNAAGAFCHHGGDADGPSTEVGL